MHYMRRPCVILSPICKRLNFLQFISLNFRLISMEFKEKPKNLWKSVDGLKYQYHVTSLTTELEETDKQIIYMEDLEKRKEVYGICGECNEPGTGRRWCQSCNSKRFKDNFKNWTSGNKDVDEYIQYTQLNAVHSSKCLEWLPFEKFEDVTYVARGGFGKIYSAKWPEGYITEWDIENQKWERQKKWAVALKSLDDSSEINKEFLNEIKTHLQIYLFDVLSCYGITQDPNTKDYMMVLNYCERGNLRSYLKIESPNSPISYETKIWYLLHIARGLQDIHSAGIIHKDLHSGNVLFSGGAYISDLGMCQPVKNKVKEGVHGVLPYMAPEVIRKCQYTKAADIYSFGIIMNEYLSEEIPYGDVSHNYMLGIKICKGHRPEISKDTPKLLANLIMKCWDAKAENRPTAKELFQALNKWNDEMDDKTGEIYSQVQECEKIRKNKLKNGLSKNKPKQIQNFQPHPQAIYTSRLIDFKDLPEPINSSSLFLQLNSVSADDYISTFDE